MALLRERLADLYPCTVQTYEWKADFVPDRHIFGSVGRTLATLSRYPIEKAERLQLPNAASNALTRLQRPQPALLVSYLPLADGDAWRCSTPGSRPTSPAATCNADR